jgi:penicillin-binding protein 1B
MHRLSRGARLAQFALPVIIVVFLALEAFSIYLFVLDRRIRRELAGQSWRQPTILVSAAGRRKREIVRLYGADWRTTKPLELASLPPHVGNAVIAAEDVRFRRHFGIDPIGIARAALRNVRAGGIAEGASTLNQQMLKQRFLTHEKKWTRKIAEMLLAINLDIRLTKDEILELYLNEVYLGHHRGSPILGVDEAARLYFDKSAAHLRADEAALLAAMIRAPNVLTPVKRPGVMRARRDQILRTMRERRMIDEPQYLDALARPVSPDRGSLPEMPYPYYLRAVRAQVVREAGLRTVLEGGLRIVCEMDPDAQRAAERAASRAVDRLRSRHDWIRQQSRTDPLQVAILSVDPRNGGIRALVGGSDYERSAFDRTTQMRRQPGSAFKTFPYFAAIASKRATTASLLLDSPIKVKLSNSETWEPQNYDQQFRGRVTLREAFERSLNVPTVRLSERVGIGRVANTAKEFGFDNSISAIPALSLGVTEVSMRELTAAYTVFPNLGERVEPFLIRAVHDRRGKKLFEQKIEKKRVADANPTYVMHTLLRGVVRRGTARRLREYGLGHAAGKTGTTNDYRDAWFVGYTADMVTTAWVGFDKGAPLRLSSAEAAIPLWGAYMGAIEHLDKEPAAPDGVTFRDIDPETGMLWRKGCPGPIREVFLDGTAPTRHCPAGLMGRIVRRVLFDRDNFDEPAAITFETFRRWANDVDRNRQQVEGAFERMKRWFD